MTANKANRGGFVKGTWKTMTASEARQADLGEIRKRVRGLGVIKGVWRMSLAEVRREAFRLLTDRPDWLSRQDKQKIRDFVMEDEDYWQFFCADCDKTCPAGTCTNWRCEACCSANCEED